MDSNSKSLGICQRFINFILSVLSSLKTAACGSTDVPVEEGSLRNGKSFIRSVGKPNGYTGSEIMVEFRHTDGFESWTQIDELSGKIREPTKDGLVFGDEQQKGLQKRERRQDHVPPRYDQKNGRIGNGKELQDFEGLNGIYSRDKKSVTFKENEGEGEKNKKKEANNSAEQGMSKVNNLPREETRPRPPRKLGPLLSVASNINEKAAAYIQRRKKDMNRNYSLDPDHMS